ncbi:GspH/FimT family pseudopilin [Macromonas nakdongensis]|uniref:GspH/FimT family pseudopilin n=1 Tax=Macromonas nakdongensis TaxID=1843082 RepID=UPI0012FE9474|nr:type II secretion system protein [Macromonas nakdongensis]
MKPYKSQFGFTIIELMIALGILGILTSIGLPLLTNFRDNATIKGAAETALQTLNNAKFESIKRNERIYISASTTCYAASTLPTCNCTDATTTCDIAKKIISDYPETTQATTLTASATTQFFEPRNGSFSTSSTITFTKKGKIVEVQLNSTGRVRECVKAGSVPGIPECS